MPLYEYYCSDCRTTFDTLRSMDKADAPITCEKCESRHTARVLSVFFAHGEGKPVAGASGGCACGNGACGCGHSHN
ncbi:MAG: zinc ribbon domain-containing protein [Chloroflexi bacterium]|nr:zinc ribbon domain-containing protein [Chloroflexota bacterium]MBI3760798.1 zinc ribbon domain-containing protein [Chloroflexota bacterium]